MHLRYNSSSRFPLSQNEVAVYPPTILEPQDLSTLHMPLDWNSSNPTPNECCLLAYRLSDEGSWRSWTNLYTSGVWTREEKATATTTDGDADDGANKQHGDDADGDGIHDLKRTPSGTRNTQNPAAKTTTDEVDPDDMILDSVNVALTRAQHLEEKEKRRLLANKFNFSDYCSDLWQYIDPVSLASTYKGILRSMMEDKTAATTAAAFERIRFDCWPASPYQLLDLLRLTLCHMESKVSLSV
ncbi:unnamed protein product [Trichobilharzia regenti]|nr:unnamed protein product [Trichobilharzia regenti]